MAKKAKKAIVAKAKSAKVKLAKAKTVKIESFVKAKVEKFQKAKANNKFDNGLLSLANNVGVTNLSFNEDCKFKFGKNVGEHHVFNSNCGSKMNNLLDLAMTIRHMKDEHFEHHVNEHKNDFANWVKDCVGEEQLANELSKYKTKSSSELLILRHIANELNVK